MSNRVLPKFSVTFVIGGKEVTLSSTDLPDNLLDEIRKLKLAGEREKAKQKFKDAAKEALSFALPAGQTASVKLSELITWLQGKGFDVDSADFFEDQVITITAFSISARGEFVIAINMALDLGLPDELRDIIDVKELGFGLAYGKEPEPPVEKPAA
jgi:hypothetical protein